MRKENGERRKEKGEMRKKKGERRNEKGERRNEDRVMNQQKKIVIDLSNEYIKMNYYQFNRQEILQKAKENIKVCHKKKKTKRKSIKNKIKSRIGSV